MLLLRRITLVMRAGHSSAANTAVSLEPRHVGMWSRSGSRLGQQNCKGGYAACSNHEFGDDSMTLDERQLAATIENMAADHLGCELGLRTDRSQHGVPLPTQGNEDEEHSPAVADSHSTLLVAPVPDSSSCLLQQERSVLPTIGTKASAVDAPTLHH